MSNKRQKTKVPLKKAKLDKKKSGRDILRTATDCLDISSIIEEIANMELADAQREGLTTSQVAGLDTNPYYVAPEPVINQNFFMLV